MCCGARTATLGWPHSPLPLPLAGKQAHENDLPGAPSPGQEGPRRSMQMSQFPSTPSLGGPGTPGSIIFS